MTAPAATRTIRADEVQVQRGLHHDNVLRQHLYGPRPAFVPFDGSVIRLLSGDAYIVASAWDCPYGSPEYGRRELRLLRVADGRSKRIFVWPRTTFPLAD